LAVGNLAYDFQLQDLNGRSVSLTDFRGQPVIVNFWATWCAPCRIEMPELQATYEKYKDDGLVILALDQDESPEIVRSFFYDEFGLTFTPLLDVEQEVAQQYGVFNFPSSFFINADGVITAIHRGPALQSQLEEYLADMIQ
jgi:peroxiredoxin